MPFGLLDFDINLSFIKEFLKFFKEAFIIIKFFLGFESFLFNSLIFLYLFVFISDVLNFFVETLPCIKESSKLKNLILLDLT
jgi:hypothetical protein